jgi:ATP-binding cassette subfamily F protein 3
MGSDAALLKAYGELQSKFEALGGYGYHTRIEQVLSGLGFPRDMWTRPLSQLSGGQRTRVYLAKLLLEEPEVLMLDEPTNHLDLDSVEWLEDWLASFRGTMIVVSHDRYFLDHVTAATWEVAACTLEAYPAPYTKYLTLRADRYKERIRRWQQQQEYIAKTEEFIRRYIAGQRSREAQGRRRRLERFIRDEAIRKPLVQEQIHLELPPAERSGDIVMTATDLCIGYAPGAPLLKAERLEIVRGMRIAVVGPNGTGKTTLLRTLLGEVPPLSGSFRLGANITLGYLSQTHGELDPEQTAVEAVRAVDRSVTVERVRTLLGNLLLSGDDALKKTAQLSGGQRSRVILASLVMLSANVLMLDEPTNHLDIPSTEIMQDVLKRFDGTIIFVTHDRYLVQSVATHIWAIEGEEIRIIRGTGGLWATSGTWDDYLSWRAERLGRPTAAETSAAKQAREERKAERREERRRTNLVQKLKRRHEELESQIQEVEQEKKGLDEAISTEGVAGNVPRIAELGLKYNEADARLKRLWDEWAEVGEQLEKE